MWRQAVATVFFVAAALLSGVIFASSMWGCGGNHPPRAVEPDKAFVPWCFRVSGVVGKKRQGARLCFETAKMCRWTRKNAVDWGGYAGIDQVGACSKW